MIIDRESQSGNSSHCGLHHYFRCISQFNSNIKSRARSLEYYHDPVNPGEALAKLARSLDGLQLYDTPGLPEYTGNKRYDSYTVNLQ
jgi:hypothetical protein